MSNRVGITAVVRVSRFNESPERAIKSILAMKQLDWREIIIVSEIAGKDENLYNSWEHDKKIMADKKIELRFERKFKIDSVRSSQLLFELPGTCQIKDRGGIFQSKLLDRVKKTKKYQRYAWDVKTDFSCTSFSLWYVFLCVVFALDWWRQLFAWFTFHTREHVRVQEIWKGHDRCLLPPHKSPLVSCCGFGLLGSSDRDSICSSNGICSTGPAGERLQGRKYFLYAMDHRDRSGGYGWKWWYVIAWIFYVLLGAAWWGYPVNAVLSWASSWGLPGLKLWQGGLQFLLYPLSTFRIGVFIFSWIFHGLLLSRHFIWSNRFWYIFVPALFPLVIPLVLPCLILLAKVDRTHDAYMYTLDPTNEVLHED
jgi:hypothetical protein